MSPSFNYILFCASILVQASSVQSEFCIFCTQNRNLNMWADIDWLLLARLGLGVVPQFCLIYIVGLGLAVNKDKRSEWMNRIKNCAPTIFFKKRDLKLIGPKGLETLYEKKGFLIKRGSLCFLRALPVFFLIAF